MCGLLQPKICLALYVIYLSFVHFGSEMTAGLGKRMHSSYCFLTHMSINILYQTHSLACFLSGEGAAGV